MPVIVPDGYNKAEPIRYRKPRNQPSSDTDTDPPQIPSIPQITGCKSSISSLLLSNPTSATATPKKKNFASGPFRGLGCAASPQVSVPVAIRTSASWEEKKVRKKKTKKKAPNQALAMASSNNSHNPSSSAVVPEVWCGPGIGFTTDAASVDCVVSRKPVSGRAKVDGDKMNHRERSSCSTRRMVKPESMSSLDSDYYLGMRYSGLDVFGARYRHVRHRSPDGLAEIMMLQNSLMMGGRSNGFDRYRDWRLNVDNMSYEELLELGDKIGYVNTGLKEDEIVHCLRQTKCLDDLFSPFATEMERKCSICQEDYEGDDEMGKLECGHFYHIDCIKQWLAQKNICPICKTVAAAQQ
ncbi:E3 ubiquitin-protein like [Actinidia chinensis var. chinensis]|uniref:RING-type E3 ubiquitin transferase n=1 Tax=Actinidia chinensis var. chinensis TaxID=1590841 RepID=A0A2R6P345_ACTCC|nr:E3 ubiquitin-protein like [Actinidia chinensis var. chinensis]